MTRKKAVSEMTRCLALCQVKFNEYVDAQDLSNIDKSIVKSCFDAAKVLSRSE